MAEELNTATSADSPFTPSTEAASSAAPERPAWASDKYYDGTSGQLKHDALQADLARLAEVDARAAAVPESADKYEVALPADYELPEGWTIDDSNPLWDAGRQFAHENGLSQEQFAALAKIHVQGQIAAHEREQTEIASALKLRDAALGVNGAARVDALNNWFGATFEPKVAAQLSKTLFTPDIVGAFERLQQSITSQGAVGFRQDGRKEPGRTDGRPEGWESMSALDKRTWNLEQQGQGRR